LPSNPTRQTIARQWQLLKLLPDRHPGMSSNQLQQALHQVGHGTSKRTVERDLNELTELFPVRCNSKGTPYGWYWQAELSTELLQPPQPSDRCMAQPITLRAWVTPGLARQLAAQPLSDDMLLEPLAEGDARLVATVAYDHALISWLLAHAGSIKVTAPDSVREALLERLRQALLLHDSD